jgi:hypothetical protein
MAPVKADIRKAIGKKRETLDPYAWKNASAPHSRHQ